MPLSRSCVPRAARLAAAIVTLALAGCATTRLGSLSAPHGARALGLDFGKDRAAAERALTAVGIPFRADPSDPDALLAERCEGAPARPCRLIFGPEGLYAAQVEVPGPEERALVDAASAALGSPSRRGEPSPAGVASLVAGWERPGWAVGVSRHAPAGAPVTAVLHLEYEEAAPPAVLGVPLGRWRVDVEAVLEQQGAVVQARDAASTIYLGCPQSTSDALTCVVQFERGRAASVTEAWPPRAEDAEALRAWHDLAARYEAEIGRAAQRSCPAAGPDRVGGDCTATWASDKLTVVVGAHRGAGSSHRGAISVYTGFAYPPLAGAAVTDSEDATP
jgi:hypothetical protein